MTSSTCTARTVGPSSPMSWRPRVPGGSRPSASRRCCCPGRGWRSGPSSPPTTWRRSSTSRASGSCTSLLLDPHLPEMLITGHEREFWEFWIKAETDNPTAITNEAIDEWISKVKAPGGLRGVLETYRAGLENGRINQELKQTKISMPILTIGAPEFFGELVEEQMFKVAEKVDRAEVFPGVRAQPGPGGRGSAGRPLARVHAGPLALAREVLTWRT